MKTWQKVLVAANIFVLGLLSSYMYYSRSIWETQAEIDRLQTKWLGENTARIGELEIEFRGLSADLAELGEGKTALEKDICGMALSLVEVDDVLLWKAFGVPSEESVMNEFQDAQDLQDRVQAYCRQSVAWRITERAQDASEAGYTIVGPEEGSWGIWNLERKLVARQLDSTGKVVSEFDLTPYLSSGDYVYISWWRLFPEEPWFPYSLFDKDFGLAISVVHLDGSYLPPIESG